MLSVFCVFGLFVVVVGVQVEGWCEFGKVVKFVGLNWESGMLFIELMQFVLVKGYGCIIDSLLGNLIIMEQVLSINDIQVFVEEWIGCSDVWNKVVVVGKVVGVGEFIVGVEEGWYVLCYVIEGDLQCKFEVKVLKLCFIVDLVQYVEVFCDLEELGKGCFYNCLVGWICELENSEMLKSYGLEEMFINFCLGIGLVLDVVVLLSYWCGEFILFYYWLLMLLMGCVDLVCLEERFGVDKCIRIQVGLLWIFYDQVLELVVVLEKVNLLVELLNSDLVWMVKDRIDVVCLVCEFFKEYFEVWYVWVDEDVVKKIEVVF